MKNNTVLYTTIYPGIESFVKQWYESVLQQSDKDFDIVIGLDCVSPEDVFKMVDSEFEAVFISADKGFTPVQVRERPFRYMVDNYHKIIFTDSDDTLLESRVAKAKKDLEKFDVVAYALNMTDYDGNSLGKLYPVEDNYDYDLFLPTSNVFGMSNSAYNSCLLNKIMEFPSECVIYDWFIATKAWLSGAKMGTSSEVLMNYRQHASNIANVLPPFTGEQILKAIDLLFLHYEMVFRYILPVYPSKKQIFVKANDNLTFFAKAIVQDKKLEDYVYSLNNLNVQHTWWSWIAHPRLEKIWKN